MLKVLYYAGGILSAQSQAVVINRCVVTPDLPIYLSHKERLVAKIISSRGKSMAHIAGKDERMRQLNNKYLIEELWKRY